MKDKLPGIIAASFGVKITQAALTLIVSILIARLIGAEGYGIYASTLAIIAILSIPADAGTGRLAPREISRALASGSVGTARAFNKWAQKIVRRSSTIIAIGALVAMYTVPDLSDRFYLVALCLLIVPVTSLAILASGVLRGTKRVVIGQSLETWRALVLIPILLATGYTENPGVMHALCAMIAAVLIVDLSVVTLGQKSLPDADHATYEVSPEAKAAWKAALLPFFIISAVSAFGLSIDVLMVGWMSGAADAGLYQVGFQVGSLTTYGIAALSMTLAPFVSEAMTQNRLDTVQKLATNASRAASAFAITITIIIILWGHGMVGYLYGEEFVPSYAIALMICISQIINASSGVTGAIMLMGGHEKKYMKIVIFATILKVLCNAILIPWLGPAAPGISVIIFTAVVTVMFRNHVKHKQGFETFVLFKA